MSARIARLAGVMTAALVLSAGGDCGGILGVDCTLIGCTDGFEVIVVGPVDGPVTVRASAGGEQREIACPDTTHCPFFFMDWAPEQVDIEVEWEGGQRAATVAPAYSTFRPNGRRCPPECRQATVAISVP